MPSQVYGYNRGHLEDFFVGTWEGTHPGHSGGGIGEITLTLTLRQNLNLPMLYGEVLPKGPGCALDDAAYAQCEFAGLPMDFSVSIRGGDLPEASNQPPVISGRGLQPFSEADEPRVQADFEAGRVPEGIASVRIGPATGRNLVIALIYDGRMYAQLNLERPEGIEQAAPTKFVEIGGKLP